MPKGEKKAGGRPPISKQYSERVKKNWIQAAAKIAKETGLTIEEHFLRMILDPDIQDTAKIAVGKLYNEALLVKSSEAEVNHNVRQGPAIYLPEIRKPDEDEAEAVVH